MNKKLKDFYSTYISNLISKGQLVSSGKLSILSIRPLFDRIVTRRWIKKVICVTNIPTDFEYSLIEELRNIVQVEGKSCKLFTSFYCIPTEIDIQNEVFRRQMSSAETDYRNYEKVMSEFTDSEKNLGKKVFSGIRKITIDQNQLDRRRNIFESFEYVTNTIKNSGEFSTVFMFLEIVTPDKDSMNLSMKRVRKYLRDNSFNYKELMANTSNYMSNCSPASYMRQFSNKEFSDVLLSDENITALCPFKTQGFIGDGTGVLVGMNRNSMTPFILNFFATGDRQVIFLNAQSGYGKTIQAFVLALGFLGQGHHVSVIDVKGDEWIKLSSLAKTLVLDFSERSSSYVNIYRLDDVDFSNPEEAKEMYNTVVKCSISLISLICRTNDTRDKKIEEIARLATAKLLTTNGVDSLYPSTFKLSKNIKYSDLISIIDGLKSSSTYKNDVDLINDMKKSLTDVFILSNTFKGKEITIKDIIDTPLIVYTLNRNSEQALSLEDKIRTVMISFLEMKKISIRKSRKKGTVCFYEEMQRSYEFRELINFINTMVTGARSSNVVVVLLCNVLSVLKEECMTPIVSNISTFLLGPVPEKDLQLLDDIGAGRLKSKLRKMSDNQKRYKHYFACLYNTGKEEGETVTKCTVPETILNILKTRDVIS